MMKCRCNKCGKEVDYKTRFVAEDGRILCHECSEGVR